MEAERYIGKKIRLILKNGFHYTGEVLEAEGSNLVILDKFHKEVFVSLDNIDLLEVLSNGEH